MSARLMAFVSAGGSLRPRRASALARTPLAQRVAPTRVPQAAFPRRAKMSASYEPVTEGEKETMDFRLGFRKEGSSGNISPWHDIPLYANDGKTLVNFVCEIPKGTAAKMEISTKERFNPIKQDIKKGALRYYLYGPSLVNYGALPQTWEDPKEINDDTGCGGDDDPIDVVEIGTASRPMGSVYAVKPFGILALVDDGETDWKVLAIGADDPKASSLNSVEDAQREFPGLIDDVTEWFRMYKTAEGKGENKYAFNGKPKDTAYAFDIIASTHDQYLKLKSGERVNDEELSLA